MNGHVMVIVGGGPTGLTLAGAQPDDDLRFWPS